MVSSAEYEHAFHEPLAACRRAQCLIDVLSDRGVFRELHVREIAVRQDSAQDVVEVVGDCRNLPSHGLHLRSRGQVVPQCAAAELGCMHGRLLAGPSPTRRARTYVIGASVHCVLGRSGTRRELRGQGIRNENVAPGPSLSEAWIAPPWFSMIQRLMKSPIPVPSRLVV